MNRLEFIINSMQNETASADSAPRFLVRLKNNTDFLALAFLFILPFALHVFTAARTVTFSDAGDFLMGIATVGNIHGPGYPLYLMTAKLFSWMVPFGSLAFRASLYSAVFASLTTCLIYWIIFRMSHSRVSGAVAGLAYAFSYTFWYESVIPETYAVNTFFIALLIVLALRWERLLKEGRPQSADNTLCIFALVFGLSLTNHFSIIFVLPAFLFFALDTSWRDAFAPRNLLRMAAFLAIGLLPYIYEPAAAFRGPAYNYGDPSTLIRWYHHVTFYYQRGGLFKYPYSFLPGRFWRYFGTLTTEFPYFWWLGGIGFLATFRKRSKKYPLFLLFLFLLVLLPIMTYSQLEPVLRAHFYYESYLVVALWIGFGTAYLARVFKLLGKHMDRLVEYAALALVMALVLLCPLSALAVHYDKVDKSDYYYARDMAKDMLEPIERGSILIVSLDNIIFPCMYMQIVEGLRPDVRLVGITSVGVPGFPGMNLLEYTPPGYTAQGGDQYTQIVDRNSLRFPVYTTIPERILSNWKLDWLGFVVRVRSGDSGLTTPEERGPVLLPGSLSKSFKDSDARWAISLPEALEAMVLHSRSDYRGAAGIYADIIPKFQENMYVPTLYGCGNFSQYCELWGQVLNLQEKYRQTVRNLPTALAIDPDFCSISLARAYSALGDFPSAINEYDRYITLYPNDSTSPLELGELYLRLEDYQKADRLLKKAVALNTTDARAHFFYGRALLLLGRKSAARRELDTAIKLDPEGQFGKLARESLKLIQ